LLRRPLLRRDLEATVGGSCGRGFGESVGQAGGFALASGFVEVLVDVAVGVAAFGEDGVAADWAARKVLRADGT